MKPNNSTQWQGYTYDELVARREQAGREVAMTRKELSGCIQGMTLVRWGIEAFSFMRSPRVANYSDYALIVFKIVKKFIQMRNNRKEK